MSKDYWMIMANNVDPELMPHWAEPDQGLHCLLWSVCPNTQGKYTCSTLFNPSQAEPGYALSLQTVQIQIIWFLKKPTDLDLLCLPLVCEFIATIRIKQSDWLKIRSGHGIFIYLAWQGLTYMNMYFFLFLHENIMFWVLIRSDLVRCPQWIPKTYTFCCGIKKSNSFWLKKEK